MVVNNLLPDHLGLIMPLFSLSNLYFLGWIGEGDHSKIYLPLAVWFFQEVRSQSVSVLKFVPKLFQTLNIHLLTRIYLRSGSDLSLRLL